jgi:hypothetical protein
VPPPNFASRTMDPLRGSRDVAQYRPPFDQFLATAEAVAQARPEVALAMLVKWIPGEPVEQTHLTMATRLVVRHSTRAIYVPVRIAHRGSSPLEGVPDVVTASRARS